jgi:LPS export ABC transporter protein LptC
MIVLAVVAAATWVATWRRPEADQRATGAAHPEPLGFYVRGARILGTDEEGRVRYRIFAERLDELPEEDRLLLTGVKVEYQPPDEAVWSITAASASSAKDISRLDLSGGVEFRSAPTDDSRLLTIVTEQLTFWPDTSSAEAKEPVEVRFGDWHLRASGLHLKGDSLRLESEVYGSLAP